MLGLNNVATLAAFVELFNRSQEHPTHGEVYRVNA